MLERAHIRWQMLRHFGPRWVLFQVEHRLKQRLGWFERVLPVRSWETQPLSSFLGDPALAKPACYLNHRRSCGARFFFQPNQRVEFRDRLHKLDAGGDTVVREAQEATQGVFRYFGYHKISVGMPPAWHCNPFSGDSIPNREHWSRIDDFGHGDIKLVWEASRFAFVYTLVRAY